MKASGRRWDLFCKVVDNFGDIGICWRLARQLVAERDACVRLWVDDLGPLARIRPGVERERATQDVDGVEVRHWTDGAPSAGDVPGEIVVEAFGCDPPASFVAAMAVQPRPPAWFNLEYLSAEDWVESHHLLPSPHPRLPLVKRFFFPGFTPRTGGLLREADLLAARDAFADDGAQQLAFEQALGIPPRRESELRVSLFSYANAQASALLEAWVASARPVTTLVPDGCLATEIATWAKAPLGVGSIVERGNLRVMRVPFLPQWQYDRLLWSCDVNVVRGEDSFVRAQWAARPMVWHIYPQPDDAHWPKLEAFLRRHTAGFDAVTATATTALFRAWNGRGDVRSVWEDAVASIDSWRVGARDWAGTLAARSDLMSQLASEAETLL